MRNDHVQRMKETGGGDGVAICEMCDDVIPRGGDIGPVVVTINDPGVVLDDGHLRVCFCVWECAALWWFRVAYCRSGTPNGSRE